jgi:hypothetical protein
MEGFDRLRDAARFYLEAAQRTTSQSAKDHFTDCALDLALTAEQVQRASDTGAPDAPPDVSKNGTSEERTDK